MGYAVTEKGTVAVPVEIRRKLHPGKGSLVDYIEIDEGVVVVPVVPSQN